MGKTRRRLGMKALNICCLCLGVVTTISMFHFSLSSGARISFYNALNFLFGISSPAYRSLDYFLLTLTTYILLAAYLLLSDISSIAERALEKLFVVWTAVLCC